MKKNLYLFEHLQTIIKPNIYGTSKGLDKYKKYWNFIWFWKLPLRKYFIRYVEEKENAEEEELEYSKNILTLYKILFNYFGAVKDVFLLNGINSG